MKKKTERVLAKHKRLDRLLKGGQTLQLTYVDEPAPVKKESAKLDAFRPGLKHILKTLKKRASHIQTTIQNDREVAAQYLGLLAAITNKHVSDEVMTGLQRAYDLHAKLGELQYDLDKSILFISGLESLDEVVRKGTAEKRSFDQKLQHYDNSLGKVRAIKTKKSSAAKLKEAMDEKTEAHKVFKESEQTTLNTLTEVNSKIEDILIERICSLHKSYLQYFKDGVEFLEDVAPAIELLQNTTGSSNGRKGSTRVFGVPLLDLARKTGEDVPGIVSEACKWLMTTDKALLREGIFRISLSKDKLDIFKSKVDAGRTIKFTNSLEASATLKFYLRDLPAPLVTPTTEGYNAIVSLYKDNSGDDRVQKMAAHLKSLEKPIYESSKIILKVCYETQKYQDVNKMNTQNIATTIGPSLVNLTGIPSLQSIEMGNTIVKFFIDYYPQLFDDSSAQTEKKSPGAGQTDKKTENVQTKKPTLKRPKPPTTTPPNPTTSIRHPSPKRRNADTPAPTKSREKERTTSATESGPDHLQRRKMRSISTSGWSDTDATSENGTLSGDMQYHMALSSTDESGTDLLEPHKGFFSGGDNSPAFKVSSSEPESTDNGSADPDVGKINPTPQQGETNAESDKEEDKQPDIEELLDDIGEYVIDIKPQTELSLLEDSFCNRVCSGLLVLKLDVVIHGLYLDKLRASDVLQIWDGLSFSEFSASSSRKIMTVLQKVKEFISKDDKEDNGKCEIDKLFRFYTAVVFSELAECVDVECVDKIAAHTASVVRLITSQSLDGSAALIEALKGCAQMLLRNGFMYASLAEQSKVDALFKAITNIYDYVGELNALVPQGRSSELILTVRKLLPALKQLSGIIQETSSIIPLAPGSNLGDKKPLLESLSSLKSIAQSLNDPTVFKEATTIVNELKNISCDNFDTIAQAFKTIITTVRQKDYAEFVDCLSHTSSNVVFYLLTGARILVCQEIQGDDAEFMLLHASSLLCRYLEAVRNHSTSQE